MTGTSFLVGRDRETAQIAHTVQGGGAVLIVGEPGVGKTSVARAGCAAAHTTRIWEGGGLAILDWVSYLPFRRALGLPLPDGDPAVIADFLCDYADGGVYLLDDLQWVDDDTVSAIALLSRRVPVVAVARPAPRGREVCRRLAEAGFEILELAALDDRDAAQVARAHNPALSADAALSVARRAEGNPLLVEGLAHAGEHTTELALALRARLLELSPAARDALHRVAVLGRPAPLDLPHSDLQQLLDLGLVSRSEAGVQVRHALIAAAVLEPLPAWRVAALHRDVAGRLDDPGEAARHWAAGGDRAKARQLALQAAETAEREVERLRCRALAATCLDTPDRDGEVLEAMARLAALGAFADVVMLGEDVPPTGAAEPEACRLRSRGLFETGDAAGAADALSVGLAAAHQLGDRGAELRLRITSAFHAIWTDDTEALQPQALLEQARAEGVADAEMHVQAAAAMAAMIVSPDAALLAHQGRRLAQAERHAWAEEEGWAIEATTLGNLGREDDAVAVCTRGEDRLGRTGHDGAVSRLRAWRADRLAWQCRYDVVLDLTEDLLARPALLAGSWDLTLRSRALALGDVGETIAADALLDDLQASALPDCAYWSAWTRAELRLGVGDARAAVKLSLEAIELAVIDLMRPQAGATLARAQWECGIPITRAGRDPTPVRVAPTVEFDTEIDALAALQAGDATAAISGFEDALERTVCRRHAMRYRLGLAEATDLVDPARASEMFAGLSRELTEVGWVTLRDRVAPLSGAPPGGRRLRATTPVTPAGVTPREHDVLALIAEGLTSRGIADHLGVSPATIETHVRSSMRKLGTRTRAEAAAAVHGGVLDDTTRSP